MSNFTFLKQDEIVGENKLEILEKYGLRCSATDFAILLGCKAPRYSYFFTSDGDRADLWWTTTPSKKAKYGYEKGAYCVILSDECSPRHVTDYNVGARPAIPYAFIPQTYINDMKVVNDITEFSYGEYPQTVVDKKFSRELEKKYNDNELTTTGKVYTTNSEKKYGEMIDFRPRTHIEYEYNGNKYIRYVSDNNREDDYLSNDRNIKRGCVYWVKVEPITWLLDELSNTALSKKVLFSGIPFDLKDEYDGDFDNTLIKRYMNRYFSRDIFVNRNFNNKEQEKSNEELIKELKSLKEEIKKLNERIANLEKNSDLQYKKTK